MNEQTEIKKRKRSRNCHCPQCQAQFISRKARHDHQMLVHRRTKRQLRMRIRPAGELYAEG